LAIGVPLKQPKIRDRKEYENLTQQEKVTIKDRWELDFSELKLALNEKTKLLVLNNPHNPTGKIYSKEELQTIADILKDYPRVIVIMDEVYEYMVFDEYEELPRMANIGGMWDRCINVLSGGKIFSATGLRIGWAVGPENLICYANYIAQINTFCSNITIQLAMADSLEDASKPYQGYENYYKWNRAYYMKQRNYFVENLAKKTDFNVWLPEGGCFALSDISDKNLEKEMYLEGKEGEKLSKDFNFLLNYLYDKKVCVVPCSPFYTLDHQHMGHNLIRLPYCKKIETMNKAFENLAKF
jgi:aspartate/methionine/tyrosine aminotransferase